MFGPRQVGEVIVGNKLSTQVTVDAFIKSAVEKEVGVFNMNGGAIAKNEMFYVLQKTNGESAKNLNYEFSDRIHPKYVERITGRSFKPEVQAVWTVSGFDGAEVIKPLRTYEIQIRVEGDLSPENFEQIFGYYTTGEILGSDTAETVRQGLVDSINSNLKKRGNSEFVVAVAGDDITVTEKYQPNKVGKKDGRKLLFTVWSRVFNNVSNGFNSDLKLLKAVNTIKGSVGSGTGKMITNYEWFCKGYKYDPNREYAHPINFEAPMYSSASGEYDVIQIIYYMPRTETGVERQYKVLTIAMDKGTAAAVLTKIKTVTEDYATIQSDLA